jgi:ribosomal protein S18 acetylase RimI-like enzyme
MALSFRFAEEPDAAGVVALVESAYRGEASRAGWTSEADLLDGQRTDAEAVLEIVRGESGVLLIAEDDGRLVGCCHLERRAGDVAYFGMFSIQPGQQGQGLGRLVLARAEHLAREQWNSRTMVMTVLAQRDELIAWYERRGYRRTGKTAPFPYGNARFGIPRRDDLAFVELARGLTPGEGWPAPDHGGAGGTPARTRLLSWRNAGCAATGSGGGAGAMVGRDTARWRRLACGPAGRSGRLGQIHRS